MNTSHHKTFLDLLTSAGADEGADEGAGMGGGVLSSQPNDEGAVVSGWAVLKRFNNLLPLCGGGGVDLRRKTRGGNEKRFNNKAGQQEPYYRGVVRGLTDVTRLVSGKDLSDQKMLRGGGCPPIQYPKRLFYRDGLEYAIGSHPASFTANFSKKSFSASGGS